MQNQRRIIETFQAVIFIQITYFYLIDDFGSVPALLKIHWQDSAQLLATYMSAFTVQMYFAYCIYAMDKRSVVVTSIIVVLALTQIGSGIAQTITTVQLESFTQLNGTKAITTLEAASALTCDVLITATLVRILGKSKGGVKSTNNILNMLMINAINRGMLTAVCALLNLILFLALPGTFYFFIGLEISGKLYMNSALATLNSRQHIRNQASAGSGADNWNSIPMTKPGLSGQRTTEDSGRSVRVVVAKRSDADPESYMVEGDYKGSNTFIEGMI